MTKLVRYAQNYLLLSLPFVLTIMVWGTIQPEREISKNNSFMVRALWEMLAWNLMVWFAVLVLFLVALVAIPNIRENTLKRIANIKERDEREQFITGRAAKTAYISTLSVLIFFLFLSIVNVNITRIPPQEMINGKSRMLNIGVHFSLLDDEKIEKASDGRVIFESKNLPLSKPAIILFLLLWQIAWFHFQAKKEAQIS